jgi:hypothetical protein
VCVDSEVSTYHSVDQSKAITEEKEGGSTRAVLRESQPKSTKQTPTYSEERYSGQQNADGR